MVLTEDWSLFSSSSQSHFSIYDPMHYLPCAIQTLFWIQNFYCV